MRVRLFITLLIISILTSVSLADDPPPTLQEVVDQLDAAGTPYVILISTGGSGYNLILVTTTNTGQITAEAAYTELGTQGGVIHGGIGMLLPNYIDYYGLSVDDDCQFSPTCFGGTSATSGGP